MREGLSAAAQRVLPASVLSVVEPRLSALPDRIGARLNPAKYAAMPEGPAQPLVLGEGDARLVIGVLNVAGQAYHWARAVESRPDRSALSLVVDSPDGFRFAAHRSVPRLRAFGSSDWRRAEFAAIVDQATHVIIESAHPLFGPLFRRDIVREVRALRRHGIRVAIVAHGSDVRDVRAHLAREPHSPFGSAALVPNARELDRAAARARRAIEVLQVPVFGSTPGVQLDLPQATWLPVAIDPDAWATEREPMGAAVPVVVHAPSRAGFKGSEVADEVLGRLHREGVIDYRRVDGVTHGDMAAVYESADIVIDSLRMGGYGVAACEAMAAGRLVLSYVNERSREVVAASAGEQPPIWPADAASLESAVRAVLDDRDAARDFAARGPAFVRRWHDGRASADALESFLAS